MDGLMMDGWNNDGWMDGLMMDGWNLLLSAGDADVTKMSAHKL